MTAPTPQDMLGVPLDGTLQRKDKPETKVTGKLTAYLPDTHEFTAAVTTKDGEDLTFTVYPLWTKEDGDAELDETPYLGAGPGWDLDLGITEGSHVMTPEEQAAFFKDLETKIPGFIHGA